MNRVGSSALKSEDRQFASMCMATIARTTPAVIGPTWSPDSRFIAYSSNGGDPVQITKGRGNNWQPDWSPDGKYIAYRSEDGDGGLFVVPALGGEGFVQENRAFRV